MSERLRKKRSSAAKGQGAQPPKRNLVRGGVEGPSTRLVKISNAALGGDRVRRPSGVA